jgi:hypothetical protein
MTPHITLDAHVVWKSNTLQRIGKDLERVWTDQNTQNIKSESFFSQYNIDVVVYSYCGGGW